MVSFAIRLMKTNASNTKHIETVSSIRHTVKVSDIPKLAQTVMGCIWLAAATYADAQWTTDATEAAPPAAISTQLSGGSRGKTMETAHKRNERQGGWQRTTGKRFTSRVNEFGAPYSAALTKREPNTVKGK